MARAGGGILRAVGGAGCSPSSSNMKGFSEVPWPAVGEGGAASSLSLTSSTPGACIQPGLHAVTQISAVFSSFSANSKKNDGYTDVI